MNQLPILKENAYLTLLIKDNFIHANLAYTNFSTQRTYILSDSTDLSSLKFRLDDIGFTKNFWYEYFDSLEKTFDWNLVDKVIEGVFQIKGFEKEELGVSGIKVLIDDNQAFFKNILISLKEFSNDIVLKVLDDKYIENICNGVLSRFGYNDIIWIDLDIANFSVYRSKLVDNTGFLSKERSSGFKFSASKIDWSNEIGLIDFVKSTKLKAFLSTENSSEEISDKWANLIAHNCEYLIDPVLHDLLRGFTTLQLLSIKQENREKFQNIIGENTAIIVTGNISNLLSKRELLFSIIDGLELEGVYDLYIDKESKLFTFGKSLIEKEKSEDIIVLRGDVLSNALKIVIPEVHSKSKNKVIYSGEATAQGVNPRSMYAFGSSLQILQIPEIGESVVVNGELKNGTQFTHSTSKTIEFLSKREAFSFEYLVIDARLRPIVYGPTAQENRIKFKVWGNGDKEKNF